MPLESTSKINSKSAREIQIVYVLYILLLGLISLSIPRLYEDKSYVFTFNVTLPRKSSRYYNNIVLSVRIRAV